MLDLNALLDGLTLVLLGLGAYVLFLLRTGTEAAIRTSAEEAARETIRQLQWPAEIARELQKTRGIERQELRFKSYGALWKELRPLAIYDATVINRSVVRGLSATLSDWYFSESGGLLLTPQARDFYFTLQDLLRTTAGSPEDWEADRSMDSERAHRDSFQALLRERESDQSIKDSMAAFEYFSKGEFDDWEQAAPDHGKHWRGGINRIAASWRELDDRQRFATLQQAGSVLRTSLATDLESRLR